MAYDIRWQNKFIDAHGFQNTVNVKDRDYIGAVINCRGGVSPIVVTLNGNDKDIYKPVCKTQARLQLVSETKQQFLECATGDGRRFKVEWIRTLPAANGIDTVDVMEWQGWIATDLYSEQYVTPVKYIASIIAHDGLGDLETINYGPLKLEHIGNYDQIDWKYYLEQLLKFTDLDLSVVGEIGINAEDSGTANFEDFAATSTKGYSDTNCFDVLEKHLRSVGATLRQNRGRWEILTPNYHARYTGHGVNFIGAKQELVPLPSAKKITIDTDYRYMNWGLDGWDSWLRYDSGSAIGEVLSGWKFKDKDTSANLIDSLSITDDGIEVPVGVGKTVVINNLDQEIIVAASDSQNFIFGIEIDFRFVKKARVHVSASNYWSLTTDGWKQNVSDPYLELIPSGAQGGTESFKITSQPIPFSGEVNVYVYLDGLTTEELPEDYENGLAIINDIKISILDNLADAKTGEKAEVIVNEKEKEIYSLETSIATLDKTENYPIRYCGFVYNQNAGVVSSKFRLKNSTTAYYSLQQLLLLMYAKTYKDGPYRIKCDMYDIYHGFTTFTDLLSDDGRTYMLAQGSLDCRSRQWTSCTFVEIKEGIEEGLTVNTSLRTDANGNSRTTGANNEYRVYSFEAGVGKRIRDLETASAIDLNTEIEVDSSSFGSTKKAKLQVIASVVAPDLATYAQKTDLHSHANKVFLDALSVDAGYFKYYAAGVSVENADKLGGVLAASYARKDTPNIYQYAQTINSDLYVNGNIIQNGATYETHAEHLNVESNLMQLNVGEPGSQITGVIPGTSIAFSGIEINRGSADPYYMGIVEGVTPLIKLGKKGNLVTVAAREDSPTNDYPMVWDDANKYMKGVAAVRDSLKLGGVAASNYARTDVNETFNNGLIAKLGSVEKFRTTSTGTKTTGNSEVTGQIYSGNSASYRTWMSANAFNFAPVGSTTSYVDVYRPTVGDGRIEFRNAYASSNHTTMLYLSRGTQIMHSTGVEKFRVQSSGTKTTGNHEATGSGAFGGVINERLTVYGKGLFKNGGSLYVDSRLSDTILANVGDRPFNFEVNGGRRFQVNSAGTQTTGNHKVTGSGTFNGKISVVKTGGELLKLQDSVHNGVASLAYLGLYDSGGVRVGYVGMGSQTNSKLYLEGLDGVHSNTDFSAPNITSSANVKSVLYVAGGFTGAGWNITKEGNAEFDNLTVRKTMKIYELLINKIRATNGSLWVSSAMKIDRMNNDVSIYRLYIADDLGVPPFSVGDIVRCQQWTGKDVKYYALTVTAVYTNEGNRYIYCAKSSKVGTGEPAVGDDIVRIGNTTNTNRQGSLYLTSDDNNAPYLDVMDGVTSDSFINKVKLRLGKLSGISGHTGYGIWGSTNGTDTNFVISSDGYAKIAGWNFDNKYLWTGSKFGSGAGIELSNDSYPRIITSKDSNNLVNMYYASSASWGIQGIVDGTNIFQLGAINQIAGWTFTNTLLHKDNIYITTGAAGLYCSDGATTSWILRQDGSGYLASNHIRWTAAGVVTFSDTVKLNWVTGINAAQDAADAANALAGTKITTAQATTITKNTVTAAYVNAFALNASSITTGTLAAARIAAGSIAADKIKTNELIVGDNIAMGTNARIAWGAVTGTSGIETTIGAQAKVDNISVGGRNLLLNSGVPITNMGYPTKTYVISESITNGVEVTISIKGQLGAGKTRFAIYNSGGSVHMVSLYPEDRNSEGVYIKTFNWLVGSSINTTIHVYPISSTTVVNSTIEWIKLEKGNKATDWTPALEDVDASISTKITSTQATQITKDTVTAAYVNAFALNASSITTGTLSASRIAALSITGDKIAAGTITTTKLAAATITADKLASNVLTAQYINFDNATGTNMDISGKISATISGLQTTILDGANIYESVENYDTGSISINTIGYGGGITKYRSTRIGNGKGGIMLFCRGVDDEVTVASGKFTVDHALKVDGVATLNNGLVLAGGAIVTGGVSVTTNFVENGVLLTNKYAAKSHTHSQYYESGDYIQASGITTTGNINGMKTVHGSFYSNTDGSQSVQITALANVRVCHANFPDSKIGPVRVGVPASGNTCIFNRDDEHGNGTIYFVAYGW